jgi:hypothetical protein
MAPFSTSARRAGTRRLCLTLAAALFGAAGPVAAGYDGPGVETCRAFGAAALARDERDFKALALVNDDDLLIERYTEKVGTQFVSSVLTGRATVTAAGGQRTIRFLCLLADDRHAVFFYELPH